MRTWCGTCGTALDPAREFCPRCGIFYAEGRWAPPLDAVTCTRCSAVNEPGRTDCGRCHATLATGLSPYCGQAYPMEHPPGPIGTAAEPSLHAASTARAGGAGDGCPSCGTPYAPGTIFCGSCGRYLEWTAAGPSTRDPSPSSEPTEATG